MCRRVHVRVRRSRAHRFQHFGESRRSTVNSLAGKGNNVLFGERARYRCRRWGTGRRRGNSRGRVAEICAQEHCDSTAGRGTAEVNVSLQDIRETTVAQPIFDAGSIVVYPRHERSAPRAIQGLRRLLVSDEPDYNFICNRHRWRTARGQQYEEPSTHSATGHEIASTHLETPFWVFASASSSTRSQVVSSERLRIRRVQDTGNQGKASKGCGART